MCKLQGASGVQCTDEKAQSGARNEKIFLGGSNPGFGGKQAKAKKGAATAVRNSKGEDSADAIGPKRLSPTHFTERLRRAATGEK